MPSTVRVRLVGFWLQEWKSRFAPNFLALVAACWKEHTNDRTCGIDAASFLTVEEEATASASTVQVTDFAIQPWFAKRRHLLADSRLAQNIFFEDIDELATTTFATAIALVLLGHITPQQDGRGQRFINTTERRFTLASAQED